MIRAATRPMAWIATKAAVCGCLALPVMSQSEGKRDQQPGGRYAVDLESEQEGGSDLLSALRLTRPWSGNITVSGFGAVAYLDTGTAGSKPDSGFMVKAGSDWRVAVFRPGEDPIGNLAKALDVPDVLGGDGEVAEANQMLLESTLRRSALGLAGVSADHIMRVTSLDVM